MKEVEDYHRSHETMDIRYKKFWKDRWPGVRVFLNLRSQFDNYWSPSTLISVLIGKHIIEIL